MSDEEPMTEMNEEVPADELSEASSELTEPLKKKNSTWEKELVKQLEVTWGDAKAILQIAKDEVGVDQNDYPEESKEKIFAKCEEVAESFEKTPRVTLTRHPPLVPLPGDVVDEDMAASSKAAPNTIVFVRDPWADELSTELNCRITNAKQLLMLAKKDLGLQEGDSPEDKKQEVFEKAREIAVTYDLTPKDPVPNKGGSNQMAIVLILIVVVAAIIGIAVGITRRNKASEETTPEVPSPTAAPTIVLSPSTATSLPVECDQVEKEFEDTSLAVAMAVSSDISEVEIEYAASVFQRTYVSLLTGEVEDLDNYCDPFCRSITELEIVSSEVVPVEGSSFEEEGCDSQLDLVFAVKGTFVGCPDTEFPGLFVTSRRQLLQLANEAASQTSSYLRGGEIRWLEESEPLCGSCPDDSASLGVVVPTEEEMKDILDPLLSVLPTVCAVTDVVTVETGTEVLPAQ